MEHEAGPTASVLEEAKALSRDGLGKAELEFVGSLVTPFFWVLRDGSSAQEMVRNGSLFFLDAGQEPFAVTAAHVVMECLEDTRSPMFVQCMVGRQDRTAFPIGYLGDRIIDAHAEIDIATLRFSIEEIDFIGRTVLKGFTKTWPPRLAEQGAGVTFCGFPGEGRRWVAPRQVSFGCVPIACYATSTRETDILIQIEREKMMRILGDEDMPENYDFGGLSGGPVLAIVETGILRSWNPAGVIIQGPNPSGDPEQSISGLEIIRVRPVHFIKSDGMIDVARWEQSKPW